MSLTKGIQFRQLLTQLTHAERIAFLSKIMNSHTDILVTSLFLHLMHARVDTLNDFNDTMSNIIRSRKDKPKQECTINIKLDQLPTALIGFTASFLEQRQYLDFSVCNRSIYLGCNSPNTLHGLNMDLVHLQDYSCVNLSSFSQIKRLDIDPYKVIQLHPFEEPQFNQITTLQLSANKKTGWIHAFVNRNMVNCDNVRTLRCVGFGSDESTIERNAFLSLLNHFPNLERLVLFFTHIDEALTADDIANICLNIKGLQLYTTDVSLDNSLLRIFSSNLKYLSCAENTTFDLDDTTFDKLEELEIITPTKQSLVRILESASQLKKISLFIAISTNAYENTFNISMDKMEIKHAMIHIMTQCMRITYMRFQVHSNTFISMLEGIECGVFKTKKQQRKELKIEIILHIDSATKAIANDVAFQVDGFLISLEASAIHDFMLILQFRHKGRPDDDFTQDIFQDLSDSSLDTKIFRIEDTLIVTNQNCKINGYQDTICGASSIEMR